MIIAQVIPLTQSIDTELLSYFSAKHISPGTLVTVPLRKKEITAVVVQTQSVSDIKSQLRGANYQIRNILHIHDHQVFSPAFLRASDAIKNFYATTTGRVIDQVSPRIISKNLELFKRPVSLKGNSFVFREKLLQQRIEDRIVFYRTLVREKMLHKESIHIICPTQELASFFFKELSGNIEDHCFLLHGKLGKKHIEKTYTLLNDKAQSSLVISTAGFIDIHQHHKSGIIIEKESSEYYRTVAGPYIDLRVFVCEYARAMNIECMWADGILRPETWLKHKTENAEKIEPINKRIFKNTDICIVNQHIRKPGKQDDIERMKEISSKKTFSALSNEVISTIKESIIKNKKIFLFVHKKSLAPNIVCNDCGNIARSPESGYPLSLYIKNNKQTRLKERIMICHMSGESMPAFDTCQFCQSWNLVQLGIGTEGVFEQLEKLFPKTEKYIIDSTHCHTQKLLKEVQVKYKQTEKSIIIVGTQKAIPLLQEIDSSVVVSLDSYFARMDYATNPKVLDLINSLVEKSKDPVLIQSRNILEESLPILNDGLYRPYIEKELQDRKQFEYPPYTTLIMVKRTLKKEYFKKQYGLFVKLFEEYNPQILTKPSIKKGFIELTAIITQRIEEWNPHHQDPRLWSLLYSLDRSTQVYINPTALN